MVGVSLPDMREDDFGLQYLGCEIGLRHAVNRCRWCAPDQRPAAAS